MYKNDILQEIVGKFIALPIDKFYSQGETNVVGGELADGTRRPWVSEMDFLLDSTSLSL